MKIIDLRATTVTVPLEAPLRHANGCHWGRFVRTIVEVETDNGLVGLGEMGGGGESAEAGIHALKPISWDAIPPGSRRCGFCSRIPTASLYNNRTQMVAAIEFACLDLLGQAWGVPVCDILGGRVRDRVIFASYLFFRYAAREGAGTVRTIDQVVRAGARAESSARLYHTQDEGRRVSTRTTSSSATARSRPHFPAIDFVSIRTRVGRRSRRYVSAALLKISITTIWRIPYSV